MRILVLGGTTEANGLAQAIADRTDLRPTLSLAGRTAQPAPPPIPFRVGGFGGVEGLMAYLERERIEAVVDATHPFAARISAHALTACGRLKVPLARYTRPPWTPKPGDDWQVVPDLEAAAASLGPVRRRVFLTTGRLELGPFRLAAQHYYIVRTIDPPAEADLPPSCELMLARGPFSQADEEDVMRRHRIEVLVSKNSGGPGAAKLDAARALGLPVVMVDRPRQNRGGEDFTTLAACMAWIEAHRTASATRDAP